MVAMRVGHPRYLLAHAIPAMQVEALIAGLVFKGKWSPAARPHPAHPPYS